MFNIQSMLPWACPATTLISCTQDAITSDDADHDSDLEPPPIVAISDIEDSDDDVDAWREPYPWTTNTTDSTQDVPQTTPTPPFLWSTESIPIKAYEATTKFNFKHGPYECVRPPVGLSPLSTFHVPTPEDTELPSVASPRCFTGHDRRKCRPFVSQLKLVFRSDPPRFATEAQKVTYACSYLNELAFHWYDSASSGPEPPPAWLATFDTFVIELTSMFGHKNAKAVAERSLHRLHMGPGETIARYLVRFEGARQEVDWNDQALFFSFKSGLLPRLKEDIAIDFQQPTDLASLIKLAMRRDAEHHARLSEQRDQHRTHSRKKVEQPRSRNLPHAPLTPKEREHRIQQQLCLYCGATGHYLSKCVLTSKAKANLSGKV